MSHREQRMTTPVPMRAVACPVCGCAAEDASHVIASALVDGDPDAAIEAGLLDVVLCNACTPDCRAALLAARDDRLRALAARERFRARNARLERREEARAAARMPAPVPDMSKSALPPAAAAALARAKAKAAGREPR
jgi:hypothetical protein